MAEVFVDSSFWCALVLRGRTEADRTLHLRADAALKTATRTGARFITTNLVVAETHQLLLIQDRRSTALAFLRGLPKPGTEVVSSGPDLERRAIEDWIERYQNQDFSLTDAVSFALMRERGIRQALTFDRHFASAGVEMLPAP